MKILRWKNKNYKNVKNVKNEINDINLIQFILDIIVNNWLSTV